MFKYFLNKIGYSALTLFGVVSVIFIIFSSLTGDPAKMMLGQNESQEQLNVINKKYGFDLPLWKQYVFYLNDLSPISVHSNLIEDYTYLSRDKYSFYKIIQTGHSSVVLKWPYLRESFKKQGKNVSEIIAETLPNTIILAVSSILIAFILGVILGVISSLNQDNWLDKSIQVISTLGMSVPSFFSAILFAWFFGFILHDYTGLEMTGSLYELDDYGNEVSLNLKNLILPALVLGIRPLAVVIQLMRNSLLEVYSQDYIRTARAKGLTELSVIKNHAIKNALNPVITTLSGWFASMLAGAVFVEYIFNWNGLGKEIVDALNNLDLPVIMGSVIIIATLFVIINIFVDLMYGWLDPRVRLQ